MITIMPQKIQIDQDIRNEFKMHSKLMISEVSKRKNSQDNYDDIQETMQPISRTVCSFLNTDGGRILIGIDDDRIIRGIGMSLNMIDHFFGGIRLMCQKFKPFNPINRLKVSIMEVQELNECDSPKVSLKKLSLSKKSEDNGLLQSHEIGGTYCSCFVEPTLFPVKRFLIVIHIEKPNPRENTVIFQNEEGLAYRRCLASNKCVCLDDLRRIFKEREQHFEDLHDEVRHDIDRFIKIH